MREVSRCCLVLSGRADPPHAHMFEVVSLDPSALAAMSQPDYVPICPSGFSCFLLESGWSWSQELLDEAVAWLEAQDITSRETMVGVSFDDLCGMEKWPIVVCSFDVRCCMCVMCVEIRCNASGKIFSRRASCHMCE